jgi:glutaminyl-peptide cyclotransferase
LLLELARLCATGPTLDPDILFAFFDGEECLVNYGPNDGLHGSRRLAGRLKAAGTVRNTRAFILLDMVGDQKLTITVPRNSSPPLVAAAFAAAAVGGARNRFRLAPGGVLDDHVPFLEIGIPAIDIIDFEYGAAARGNEYWHTPQDTLDKLSAESLAIVGRVVVQMVNRIGSTHER